MATRYDDDDVEHSGSGDREISLGTGTVLAIFLGLALVCSLFFGLGYSMGRKSAPASGVSGSTPSSLNPFSTSHKSSTSSAGDTAAVSPPDNQVTQPLDVGSSSRPTANGTPAPATSVPSRDHAAPAKPTPTALLPPAPAAVSIDPATQSYVQVAAVSRKEDADLLLTALKRRGYAGLIRPQTQDKLLHIQVGPFPSKKDAEGMRQRLIADGYNPIIK